MLFQMRFRTLFTLLLSLIVPAGSAPADMCFNFENRYRYSCKAVCSDRLKISSAFGFYLTLTLKTVTSIEIF